MYRRKSSLTEGSDDLAPQDSYAAHRGRWTATINMMEDILTSSLNSDAAHCNMNLSVIQHSSRGTSHHYASIVDEYFSVLSAPGISIPPPMGGVGAGYQSVISRKSLREWIRLGSVNSLDDASGMKKYFENSASLLHSLVLKIVITEVKDGKADMAVAVDPMYITLDNLEVYQSINEKDSIHFIRSGSEDTASLLNQKYAVMKALGTVAYDLLMRGSGPPIQTFLPSTATSFDGTARLLLSLEDYDEKSDQSEEEEKSKRQRVSDANKQARISAAMIHAGVPYPLCRFVVDLLGGECSDGLLFRSDSSFDSFSDIIGDLEQMIQSPEAFIHLAIKDQWRLAFGEKMHGREAEKKLIMDAAALITGTESNDSLFDALALVLPRNKQQIIMVSGQPGCGKSRLVMEAKKSLEHQGWLFLSCKFDRIVHSEPLSIIAGAFDEFLALCDGSLRQRHIRTKLKSSMSLSDVSILSKHVPRLAKYLDSPLVSVNDFEANKDQIHGLFSKLLAVLSASGQAVAFFGDDLQWADAASLELIAALTNASGSELSSSNDTVNPNKTKVLIIGSYRVNEVSDNLQLVQMLDDLQKASSSVQLTNVAVQGFDSNALNRIVSESLCLPLRRTKPLSDIILHKTDGIIIHIIEFIGRLTVERVLSHSFIKGWEWDREVLEACPISDSVAELFTFKLNTLSKDELLSLQICSIFGIGIEQRLINLLKYYDGDNSVDINRGLKVASEMGLVETHGAHGDSKAYKFAHDLISQAVFDTIHEDKRPQLLKKLVSALIKNTTASNEIDAGVIFIIVDLINRIPKDEIGLNSDDEVLYATMNNKAGKQALLVPDFVSAAKYSESGIAFLNASHWQSHHELMLSIYETSVIALYSSTNIDQDLLKERINKVFDHASSINKEFRTRLVWIKLLSTTSLQDAVNECHTLLERLGEPIDSSNLSPSQACSELVRVKEIVLGGNHKLVSQMSDPTKIKVMKVMSSLFNFYYHQRSYMLVRVVVRMVEISLQHGCSEDSYFALASFASLIIANLGDIDIGVSLARKTLWLMSKSSHNINLAMPSMITAAYGLVLWWKEPLQATMDQLLHGCRLAFEFGNISFAMNNAKLYITRILYCGKNIDTVLIELGLFAQKSSMHGQTSVVKHYLAPFNNILRKLKGLDEQALPGADVFINNDDLLCELMSDNAVQIDFESLMMLEITMAYILRDTERLVRLTGMLRDNFTKKTLVFNSVMMDFYAGLAACYLSREYQDVSYIPQAEEVCEKVQWMVSHSKWNFESKFNLIQAERHYTKGEMDLAAASYEAAINSARMHKFVNELALSYECAAYFYKDQGNEAKSMEMFKCAKDAYTEWGAVGKANALDPMILNTGISSA